MKTVKYLAMASIMALATCMTACSSDNDEPGQTPVEPEVPEVKYTWSTDGGLKACDHLLFSVTDNSENAEGTQIGNGDAEFVFTGKQTLKKGTYLLKGWVYIANGAELTIEPGTIIKGDKQTKASLICERGGKLIARGSASGPIVFTSEEAAGSRKPGDWGGLIICGKARNNQTEMQIEGGPRTKHGGNDDADNSGVLSYVRIEFAGYPFQTDQEINGLTLGSVGSGTQIDHVQVSYTNDDSYEWFGGTVNCKYLVAYHGWDDDFDTDNGYSGTVQYGLTVRDAKIADKSQSNGFESDNNAGGSDVSPYTTATFSNITIVGPKAQTGVKFENTTDFITGGKMNPNNGSALGKFQSAMQIRRSSRLNIINSVALGWPIGLIRPRLEQYVSTITCSLAWTSSAQMPTRFTTTCSTTLPRRLSSMPHRSRIPTPSSSRRLLTTRHTTTSQHSPSQTLQTLARLSCHRPTARFSHLLHSQAKRQHGSTR